MAPRKRRNPSPPSTEAIAIQTTSLASNPRNPEQAKTSVSSSTYFHKGKRGRPKKSLNGTRSNGDLKNSAVPPTLAILEFLSITSDSTSITTSAKNVKIPEISNSKNEKPEIAFAGEVSLKETAYPEQTFSPATTNEGAAGDKSLSGNQPPRLNLNRKKGLRKGKPNRAPIY